jgi:hypothetical protein
MPVRFNVSAFVGQASHLPVPGRPAPAPPASAGDAFNVGQAGARCPGTGRRDACPTRIARVAAVVLLLAVAGCVSKKTAQMEARQAYSAGQAQAAQQALRPENTSSVYVLGKVTNHTIPWTAELTLAQAIVEANYVGIFNPKMIRVTRNGQSIEVEPNDLLKGNDIPLLAGDAIQIF